MEKLHPLIGGSAEPWTDSVPLPGGDIPHSRKPDDDFLRFTAHTRMRWPFLSEPLTRRLARAYGTRVASILGDAKSLDDLGEDFGGGLTRAEVDYLREHEWAQTSSDILWRRSKLGLHAPKNTSENLDRYLAQAATHAAT